MQTDTTQEHKFINLLTIIIKCRETHSTSNHVLACLQWESATGAAAGGSREAGASAGKPRSRGESNQSMAKENQQALATNRNRKMQYDENTIQVRKPMSHPAS